MFKFSLKFCLWLALLIGSVMGLVVEREPWVRENKKYTKKELEAVWPRLFSDPGLQRQISPDETRGLAKYFPAYSTEVVMDITNYQQLCHVAKSANESIYFLDNETLVAIDRSRPGAFHSILHRRFPEWWWGIFYRPLFWIAAVVFAGTVFEFVSMRKRLRTG